MAKEQLRLGPLEFFHITFPPFQLPTELSSRACWMVEGTAAVPEPSSCLAPRAGKTPLLGLNPLIPGFRIYHVSAKNHFESTLCFTVQMLLDSQCTHVLINCLK